LRGDRLVVLWSEGVIVFRQGRPLCVDNAKP
jgi:hypothetical protein